MTGLGKLQDCLAKQLIAMHTPEHDLVEHRVQSGAPNLFGVPKVVAEDAGGDAAFLDTAELEVGVELAESVHDRSAADEPSIFAHQLTNGETCLAEVVFDGMTFVQY